MLRSGGGSAVGSCAGQWPVASTCVCCRLAGITSLIGSGVYTAAYPLHDVSIIITLITVVVISLFLNFSKVSKFSFLI